MILMFNVQKNCIILIASNFEVRNLKYTLQKHTDLSR